MSPDEKIRRLLRLGFSDEEILSIPGELNDNLLVKLHHAIKFELGKRKKQKPKTIHYREPLHIDIRYAICGSTWTGLYNTTEELKDVTCKICIKRTNGI